MVNPIRRGRGPMSALTTTAEIPFELKPLVAEIDVFGITDRGRVRSKNADHFLIASYHRAMQVHGSSVGAALPPMSADSRGFLLLVADGVGGLAQAAEGSEQALFTIAQSLLDMGEISLLAQPQRADEI